MFGVSGHPPSNIEQAMIAADAAEKLRIDELITAASRAATESRWEASPNATMTLEVVLYGPLDAGVLKESGYIEGLLAVLSHDVKELEKEYRPVLSRDQVRHVTFKREVSDKARYQIRVTSDVRRHGVKQSPRDDGGGVPGPV